jgi:hypothetical protein
MSYALRKDGLGWRAVNGPQDVADDESYSAVCPPCAQPSARQLILMQIDEMERAQMLPRGPREALLAITMTLATTQGATEAQLYSSNIAYRKIKDFDSQISALRAQL